MAISTLKRDALTITYNVNFPGAQLLLSAHGSQESDYFTVPNHLEIWFYCPDGFTLLDVSPINFAQLKYHPYEVYKGKSMCPNYKLSFYEDDSPEVIKAAAEYFETFVLVHKLNSKYKDNMADVRPIEFASINKVPWYSFTSTTLRDVVKTVEDLEADGMMGTSAVTHIYSSILCTFCRASSSPFARPKSYDASINTKDGTKIITS